MSEQPTNTYSRDHPGHAEPDRYLDDEGRCTFCGRSVWEETAKQLERKLAAALEVLEEARALNLQMMRFLQQADHEGKATVGIRTWLRGIKSPPLGWVGDRAKYALAILGESE